VITGLDHVVLLVNDIGAGAAAYQTLFGCAPAWQSAGDGADRVLFTLDNMTLELMSPKGFSATADRIRAVIAEQGEGLASICFRASYIAKMHRRLDRLALKPEPITDAESRDAISGATLSWKRTRAAMMDYARAAQVPLAIEPLHPAYAADRACVNTTKLALDICDRLDPQRTGALGLALDVYHIWWDPELKPQLARAGKDRLLAFHVCDWLVPTRDILNDRGMMGDGVIDIKSLRGAVEAEGFAGYCEIEIFSEAWWGKPMDEVLRACIARHRTVV
jgi:sugar phosphate isomerase/epimerase